MDSQGQDNHFDLDHDLEVRRSTYEWSVRVFKILQRILKVNIKLHQSENQVSEGDIFLFNHFARFETFIPQYLIYKETGALSRSVAASDFFVNDDAFSNYLLNAGAVPHQLPNLLPLLASEIIRGRKVIVFPEGGMVKDRLVVDGRGKYSVYSRSSKARRKHHTGPAVLAIALDVFKQKVIHAHQEGQNARLQRWAEHMKLEDVEQLLNAARRPTVIVPANITFYPIRVNDNLLRKGAELLNRGLSRRLSEELLIEGNILLKHTDMDVRFGESMYLSKYWRWLDKPLLQKSLPFLDSLEKVFALNSEGLTWNAKLLSRSMRRHVLKVRDDYMRHMYSNVTVNLSHLASKMVMQLVDGDCSEIDQNLFQKMLYVAVKNVQRAEGVHLHRSLRNPETYAGLLDGGCDGLGQFLNTAVSMGLLKAENGTYRFLPKLVKEHPFDEIRLENLLAVYANEVAPLREIGSSVRSALKNGRGLDSGDISRLRFDDERAAYRWDKMQYSKPRHASINDKETATADPAPFLFDLKQRDDAGIVLVHGFLSSPAEVRELGEQFAGCGYSVLGVRLKGHGTSPWDLRERSFEDWLASVERGYAIMAGLVRRVYLVGFSTGGALSLLLAAKGLSQLAAVAAVSVPLHFRNKNMMFVPLMHNANRFVRWASSYEGVMPFRSNENTEQPEVNYRHMPIRGLYELRRMVGELDNRLENVRCPVMLLQGRNDPVVIPSSAARIYEKLSNYSKTLKIIDSDRHGILKEPLCRSVILEFIEEQTEQTQSIDPVTMLAPTWSQQ